VHSARSKYINRTITIFNGDCSVTKIRKVETWSSTSAFCISEITECQQFRTRGRSEFGSTVDAVNIRQYIYIYIYIKRVINRISKGKISWNGDERSLRPRSAATSLRIYFTALRATCAPRYAPAINFYQRFITRATLLRAFHFNCLNRNYTRELGEFIAAFSESI